MKKVYNKIIPFKGYKAITIWPYIFIRKNCKSYTEITERHENIHGEQQKEMLLIFFYLWCGIEYIIKLIIYNFDFNKTYHNISFEQEAYNNEQNKEYLLNRKHYSWIKYIT